MLIETLEAHKSTGKKAHSQILRSEKGEWNSKDAPLPQYLAHTSKATNRYFSISLSALLLRSTGTSKSSSLSLYVSVSVSKSTRLSVSLSLSLSASDLSHAPRSLPLSVRPSLEQALWQNPKMSSRVQTGPQRQKVPSANYNAELSSHTDRRTDGLRELIYKICAYIIVHMIYLYVFIHV